MNRGSRTARHGRPQGRTMRPRCGHGASSRRSTPSREDEAARSILRRGAGPRRTSRHPIRACARRRGRRPTRHAGTRPRPATRKVRPAISPAVCCLFASDGTIAEIEPGKAVAVIERSEPHFHLFTRETYKVLRGTLFLASGGVGRVLGRGESFTIECGNIHHANAREVAWVEVVSVPPWSPDDHFLV